MYVKTEIELDNEKHMAIKYEFMQWVKKEMKKYEDPSDEREYLKEVYQEIDLMSISNWSSATRIEFGNFLSDFLKEII